MLNGDGKAINIISQSSLLAFLDRHHVSPATFACERREERSGEVNFLDVALTLFFV